MLLRDREDAGRQLARRLKKYEQEHPLVLGLPRGGVVVAAEVARALGAELDVWIARKVGAPEHPEFAVGAVAEGGVVSIDRAATRRAGLSDQQLDALIRRKLEEVKQRELTLRGDRPPPRVEGRTVILVDDGIATGRTMEAALKSVRMQKPRWLVLAAPVAELEVVEELRALADELVVVEQPPHLFAIGSWFENFQQTSDDEVISLLRRARGGREERANRPTATERDQSSDVELELDDVKLSGVLSIPAGATGMVIFAHGSGSSRFSPRNRLVASHLRSRGIATLLFDLLTALEEREDNQTAELRFDIEFLASRLVGVTDTVAEDPALHHLRLGYFGASTGAAAALRAAARRPQLISAVVSRGGRPDLAEEDLRRVIAPTLLLVGAQDQQVLELNQSALEELGCEKELKIIPGATHLFEESGALEQVAGLAGAWFERHFARQERAEHAPGA